MLVPPPRPKATHGPGNGGCNFFENPDIDSRGATPVWVRVPPSVAELATEEFSTRSSTFSIWLTRAAWSMVHDGRSIHIRIGRGCRSTELTIPPELEDGLPFVIRGAGGSIPSAGTILPWLPARLQRRWSPDSGANGSTPGPQHVDSSRAIASREGRRPRRDCRVSLLGGKSSRAESDLKRVHPFVNERRRVARSRSPVRKKGDHNGRN